MAGKIVFCFVFCVITGCCRTVTGLKMLTGQIEYIIGHRWNEEYNKWVRNKYIGYSLDEYVYHALSKVNVCRRLKKIYNKKLNNIWTISLSKHPDVTWDIICANPDYQWAVSHNPNITWDIIQANPDKPWNWYEISRHPNITLDIVLKNPNYNWFWPYISLNPNITWDIIRANPSCQWFWPYISQNPNITWEIIRDNPGYPWSLCEISQNPNITWDIIKANPKFQWKWNYISENPNITWDIIQANTDKPWDKYSLYGNKLTAQARISQAKYQLKAHQETNYLARYIVYRLVTISLEHGY